MAAENTNDIRRRCPACFVLGSARGLGPASTAGDEGNMWAACLRGGREAPGKYDVPARGTQPTPPAQRRVAVTVHISYREYGSGSCSRRASTLKPPASSSARARGNRKVR